MRLLNARRAISACVVSAASVAALATPGTALATTKQCEGGNILGAGSSAQKLAQKEVWDSEAKGKGLGFNIGKNKAACSAAAKHKEPEVKYESIGSGAGLEKWGVNGKPFNTGYGFVATDEPVNQEQKEEIEEHNLTATGKEVQSIPVLQFAVAVLIHLPAGCEATSTPDPGRLVLSNHTLEEIWNPEPENKKTGITKWSQIKEDGDSVSGTGCNANETIKHVVRLDESGTSHVFKRYLGLIQTQLVTGAFENENGQKGETWNAEAEGEGNQVWPKADHVIRPGATGGGEEVAKVFAEESSIGYANLADARGKFGVASKERFWAPVEDSGAKATKTAEKFADPSTLLEETTTTPQNSNCTGEKYTNGTSAEKFPPKFTYLTWNNVTSETKQKKYPICGLTYDMGLTNAQSYGLTEATFQTATDYLHFVTNVAKEGGEDEVNADHDYEKVPASVNKEIAKGIEELKNFP